MTVLFDAFATLHTRCITTTNRASIWIERFDSVHFHTTITNCNDKLHYCENNQCSISYFAATRKELALTPTLTSTMTIFNPLLPRQSKHLLFQRLSYINRMLFVRITSLHYKGKRTKLIAHENHTILSLSDRIKCLVARSRRHW